MIKTLDEFIKKNPHLKDFYPLVGRLQTETDTGLVLISTSYADHLLTLLLKSFFLKSKLSDGILRDTGPLGPFFVKVQLCHCLGLIKKEEYHELEVLKDIRNIFAHEFKMSLDADETKALIDKLTLWDSNLLEKIPITKLQYRDRFKLKVSLTLNSLVARHLDAKKIQRETIDWSKKRISKK